MTAGERSESEWRTMVEVFVPDASDPWRRTLEPLVTACQATPLRRFFPYTSVNELHFAETAWPFVGIQDAYVLFTNTGDYEVRRGDGERWAVVASTRDPVVAATATVGILGL